MLFKITAVKTVTDPQERMCRLAQLYGIFENTPSATITRQDDDAAQGAEAKAIKLQRRNDNTSLKKQQGEVT